LGTVFSATLTANMQSELVPKIPPQLAQSFSMSAQAGEGNQGAAMDYDELKIKLGNGIDALTSELTAVTDENLASLTDVWSTSPFTANQPLPASAEQAKMIAQALSAQKNDVLEQLDVVHRTFKEVWAKAIQHIFYGGCIIVFLGFLVTLFIPEVPLPPKKTS